MILRLGVEVWSWNWSFEVANWLNFELEFRHEFKSNIEIKYWNFEIWWLVLKILEFENLGYEGSDLEIEIEHRQFLKYVCCKYCFI